MPNFEIEFIDGKCITVEADVYPEQRDDEWVFRVAAEIVAQYQCREVRGIQQIAPPQNLRRPGGY